MLAGSEAGAIVGQVRVMTVNNRTMTAAEHAELVLAKLIHIADTAPPALRDQAHEFRDRLRALLTHAIRLAVEERRAWDAHLAATNGRPEISDLIRTS